MLAVTKKNGTLHICLDPKDLNHAIWHEQYPLPTIEDVATRLYGAKLFTILDIKMASGMLLWTNHHSAFPHHILRGIWAILMEQNALWYLFSTGDFSAKDA